MDIRDCHIISLPFFDGNCDKTESDFRASSKRKSLFNRTQFYESVSYRSFVQTVCQRKTNGDIVYTFVKY